MKGVCCDPLKIGCTNKIAPRMMSLKHSPHHQIEEPCQRCRVRRAAKRREEAGMPPCRSGANQMGRL